MDAAELQGCFYYAFEVFLFETRSQINVTHRWGLKSFPLKNYDKRILQNMLDQMSFFSD